MRKWSFFAHTTTQPVPHGRGSLGLGVDVEAFGARFVAMPLRGVLDLVLLAILAGIFLIGVGQGADGVDGLGLGDRFDIGVADSTPILGFG